MNYTDKWKMVVLDDDPTGIQTVHGCLLITQWDEESIRLGFSDSQPFFYILTNTRAMTRDEAARVTREAMEAVIKVNEDYGYRLIIVSRSDSCLRGHFPLETDVMRQCLESHGYTVADKTLFCPAFIEAGRVTIDGVHYLKEEDGHLIPVSETEFARDNVFGYHTSVLTEYIKEKGANPDDYEIINAQSYDELQAAAQRICSQGSIIRSSSSLPKAISGIPDIPLLDKRILSPQANTPPLFVIGSHVQKTTRQLECLLQAEGTCGIEVDVQRILDDAAVGLADNQFRYTACRGFDERDDRTDIRDEAGLGRAVVVRMRGDIGQAGTNKVADCGHLRVIKLGIERDHDIVRVLVVNRNAHLFKLACQDMVAQQECLLAGKVRLAVARSSLTGSQYVQERLTHVHALELFDIVIRTTGRIIG